MTVRKASPSQVTYISQGIEKSRKPQGKRPFGNRPSRLNWKERRVWKQLVHASVQGVLLPSDRVPFELLVKLAARLDAPYNEDWVDGNPIQAKPLTVGERKVLITLAAKFGMTPGVRNMIVDKQAQSQWVVEENHNHGL